jgi:hypothetical protein
VPAAIETTRKAIALAEGLVSRDPAATRPRIALAECLHRASLIFPDDPSRRAAAHRSSEIAQSIPPGSGEHDRVESALLAAMNSYNLGHHHWQNGRRSEAIAAFLAAQAVYDRLLSGGDRSLQTRDLAGRNLLFLCRAYSIDQLALALAAGHRAESIVRELVREYPDRFDMAWQLSLVHEELGLIYIAAERWQEAILACEETRRVLKEMAGRHGKVVSRMATIQSRIASADINLSEAYASDPVKYAAARRALAVETYEICDKLSVVMPLSFNCRIAYAMTSFTLADDQVQNGQSPDLELLKKAERIREELRHETHDGSLGEAELVVIRRRLAEDLADRGRGDEAARYDRHSLDTARGRPELLYDLAVSYARDAALTGKLPTKMSADQLRKRRSRFVASACETLARAAADGFKDVARVRRESSFAPLRSNAAFAAILADIEFPAQPFRSE